MSREADGPAPAAACRRPHLNHVALADAQLAPVPGHEVVNGACVQGWLAGAETPANAVTIMRTAARKHLCVCVCVPQHIYLGLEGCRFHGSSLAACRKQ